MTSRIVNFQNLSASGIQEILPHRYPFLLIDRIETVTTSPTSPVGDSIVAYKAISQSEPFFQGHFPDQPVMPGVLILEALSQAAGCLMYQNGFFTKDRDSFYLVGIDNAKFRAPVFPGHLLKLIATMKKVKLNKFWWVEGRAYLSDPQRGTQEALVAEAKILGRLFCGDKNDSSNG